MSHAINTAAQCAESNSAVSVTKSDEPKPLDSIEETRRVLKSFPVEIPDSFRGRVDKSDLVQDVLLKISENDYGLDAMKPQEQRAFLRKMLSSRIVDLARTHLCFKRDVRREQPLENDPLGSDSTPSSILVWNENQDALQAALHELPVDHQTVLRLRHREGMTFPQIGEIMGRSPDAVRILWGRALVRLTERLSS